MINSKLITAEVNLGLSIAFAIHVLMYMCLCVYVHVHGSRNATPFRVVPLQCLAARFPLPSYSDALSNGRNKGRNWGGSLRRLQQECISSCKVSTSLYAREIASGCTSCSYGYYVIIPERHNSIRKNVLDYYKNPKSCVCARINPQVYFWCFSFNLLITCYNNKVYKVYIDYPQDFIKIVFCD